MPDLGYRRTKILGKSWFGLKLLGGQTIYKRFYPIQRLTIGQLMTIKNLDLKDLAVRSIPVIGLLIVEAAFEGVEIEISAAVLDAGVL